jgi:hypothetical protein
MDLGALFSKSAGERIYFAYLYSFGHHSCVGAPKGDNQQTDYGPDAFAKHCANSSNN